jgi:AraC family transcriptional regulator
MILRYVNSGQRWFGEKPYLPFARQSWEFYAVTEGKCGLILEDNERLPLKQSHFWLLPPHFMHGWYGEMGRPCSVLVFHYASVPQQLADIIPRGSFHEQPLTRAQCRYLRDIESPIEPDYYKKSPLNDLRHHKALMELALFILEGRNGGEPALLAGKSAETVETALTWFRQNIRDHPTLQDVARAIHVSPSHLRRLFQEVRNQSPSEAILEAKIDAATHALTDSNAKIATIAAECGFSSASVFCRSFKALKHCTPVEWRQRMPV